MWFSEEDYNNLGSLIKWNPAVKSKEDRDSILKAVKNNFIDVIATDHAPHTFEEKSNNYLNSPSGGPLIQFSLPLLLELSLKGKFKIEEIVQKTSHNVAELFQIKERGFIREGYFADLVLFDLSFKTDVSKEKIYSKCGWSPLKDESFNSKVIHTIVSGNHIYKDSKLNNDPQSMRLEFDRD